MFLAKFFNKHHYCYCEQVEMSAYVGDYIKSYYWFTLSQICQSSNIIAYHFLKVLSYAILIHLQTFRFPCDLVIFLKASQLSCVPFLLVVMSLMVCVWSPWMYHNRNLSLWPCFQAKVLLVCFMTSFGYHVLFCLYLFCVYMFLCG